MRFHPEAQPNIKCSGNKKCYCYKGDKRHRPEYSIENNHQSKYYYQDTTDCQYP